MRPILLYSHADEPITKALLSSTLIQHIIWSTEGQRAIIDPTTAKRLYHYIGDLVLDNKCTCIAGRVFPDHLQLIIKYTPDTILLDLITDIKVGSALWVTTHCSGMNDFAWQKSDFAFSVSFDEIGNLINQIEQSKSFENETACILTLNGVICEPQEIFE